MTILRAFLSVIILILIVGFLSLGFMHFEVPIRSIEKNVGNDVLAH
ncbi:MAG: hypothetical protein ABF461_01635 [Zymomonas mobilis subsp. pomaceae]|uniref:Uncharacterized protein n=1 Tax=Zymomonas mobilis subsp. pomaceae (strain ATCC 29192 / DSM 22645 / JCM 10191 / CCUG 17912 / NBRC 13757 / NCIMB 11200 / NRRL B-4491 / Barker I) TaxID=579138 RepID=F8ERR8_ZYMMT|nr:hypothetical protein [Zymomonas mobilis]AEI37526.1 hypothetical protein Zymop_0624 [Zymomonas mobilis subsp. pomaceae ATCC 29192]MDX5948894.1 hypothetical protein [Zymomonas mobilis subsp. pomaceae]